MFTDILLTMFFILELNCSNNSNKYSVPGYGVGFDDVKIVGDLASLKFVAYYLKAGKVIAVATLASDPLAAKFAERLASRKPALTKEMLDKDAEAWTKEL